MKEVLASHGGKVRLQESRRRLVERIVFNNKVSEPTFTMKHDIFVEMKGTVFILDTKYKEISRFENNQNYRENINSEVKQADLYQMVTYAWKRDVKDVYLLYPMYRFEEPEPEFPYAVCESPSGNINIHFIRIPFIFEQGGATEIQLKKVIEQIFEIE